MNYSPAFKAKMVKKMSRPGIPEGISGLDQYAELFADPVKCMEEEWLDYLAPQLYWPSSQPEQDYGTLLAWWSSIAGEGRHVFAGNYLSKLGTEEAWSIDEFRQQLDISRAHRDEGSKGNIFYHGQPFFEHRENIAEVVPQEFYDTPALTPPIAREADRSVEPPEVHRDGDGGARLSHPDADSLLAWVVYRHTHGAYVIDRVVPAARERIELSAGRWAISAAGRHGIESLGVEVEL